MTDDKDAINKQKELIGRIHAKGAEVVMSSHVNKYKTAERVLQIAFEHKRRGADILKIVAHANNMEEQLENLKITDLLRKELGIPFFVFERWRMSYS